LEDKSNEPFIYNTQRIAWTTKFNEPFKQMSHFNQRNQQSPAKQDIHLL